MLLQKLQGAISADLQIVPTAVLLTRHILRATSVLHVCAQVVDMFGSGLPVCAASYSCIDELVHEGKNGLLFSTAPELAACLARMLTGFPSSDALGMSMKQQMQSMPFGSWEETWPEIVSPAIDRSWSNVSRLVSQHSM